MKKVLLIIACVATVMCVNAQAVKVSSAGNVGIGTGSATPAQKLHVVGNTFLNGNVGIGTNTPSQKLHVVGNSFLNGNVGIGISSPSQKLHVVGNTYLNGNLGVGVASPSQKLHVVGNTYLNGNLGIGIATPTQKLHVSGNTILNGNVGINDGINSNYKLQVGGQARFASGWIGLILGWSSDDYCPAIYTEYNNAMWVGRPDRWLNHLWCYNIDYQYLAKLSDIRLKENIQSCSPLLTKLKEVHTYNYNYTDEYFKDFTSSQKQKAQKKEYGFLAQELQDVFPELVSENESGMLSIRYVDMIPILTAAINELQQGVENRDSTIGALQQKVASLESILVACCSNKTQKNMQEFDLTGSTDANTGEMRVYQNAPNPFTETTIISCHIPETIKKAELCIYDMSGSRLKCLTVTERGTTTIQIQAGQLAAGVYTYLLIGDGKNSDAKQMIFSK